MYELTDSRRHEAVGCLDEARPFVTCVIAFENDHLRAGMPFAEARSSKAWIGPVDEYRVHLDLRAQASELQQAFALDDGEAASAQEERGDTSERGVVRRDEDPQEMFPARGRIEKARRQLARRTSTGRLAGDTLSASWGGRR
jgi:hypothetical protein